MLATFSACYSFTHPPIHPPIHPSTHPCIHLMYFKYSDQKTEDQEVELCAEVQGKSEMEPDLFGFWAVVADCRPAAELTMTTSLVTCSLLSM